MPAMHKNSRRERSIRKRSIFYRWREVLCAPKRPCTELELQMRWITSVYCSSEMSAFLRSFIHVRLYKFTLRTINGFLPCTVQ
ncbi:hypothetical protein V5799_033123 [Amblyomma americanum]|uniref:Uncharacterized protein n=1 Tax=Amblyomma americanum TaxID=6943 RepID=A0AAQ4DP78_AMBAM